MIVKNESKIIKRLFDSVVNIIDCYCICDTGSTDNTIETITNYFNNKNISGKIVNEEFKNFCYNRNFALDACIGMSDYILLLDADMILEVGTFNKNFLTTFDEYNILQGSEYYNYYNKRIIKNNGLYKYYGVTHEYISSSNPVTSLNLNKDVLFINDIGDGGSKQNKFIRDIELLKQGIIDEPENTRYYFYLGNSYHDSNQNEKAIETYKKLINMKEGWVQEKYISCIRIYESYCRLNQEELGIHYLILSTKYDKNRVEGIYRLIKYYCIHELNDVAYQFYFLIQNYFENDFYKNSSRISSNLFCLQLEYKFYLPYYMIIVSEKIKKYEIGIRMYEIIFYCKFIDPGEWWLNNLIYNLQFFINKVNYNDNNEFFKLYEQYIILIFDKLSDKNKELVKSYEEHRRLNLENTPDYNPYKVSQASEEMRRILLINEDNIPNIIHFCFITNEPNKEFYYTYYLSILSAYELNKPEKIYFYYNYEFSGKWWNLIKPLLTLEKVEIPEFIGKKKIKQIAHKADFIRLNKLYERGGVYIDIDTISNRPYKELLNNKCVMAREGNYGLCNAIMLASKNSKFLDIWIKKYEENFIEDGWNESSVILPKKIFDDNSSQNRNLITVLDEDYFFKPSFYEIDKIFELDTEINNNLITLHLWQSKSKFYMENIDVNWIYNNKHTLYSKIAMKFICKHDSIPKIFIQTSKYKIPKYVVDMIKDNLSNEWNYYNYIDGEDIQFFLDNPLDEFPNIIEKFKSISNGAHRADLFRYYYLYINGGVYLDSDAMLYDNIENIIKDYRFCSIYSSIIGTIFNGFLACSPRNDIIYNALKNIYNIDIELLNNNYQLLTTNLYEIIHKEKYYNIKLYREIHNNEVSAKTIDDNNNVIFVHYCVDKIIPQYSLDLLNINQEFFIENSFICIKAPQNYLLHINEAIYYNKDVSLIINSFIIKESNKLLLINDNYNKLFGDPAFGVPKKLLIKYSFIKNDNNILIESNNKIKKYIIIADWLLTSIYLEPYIFCKNLIKFGWKIIIQSKLDIEKIKKRKSIILCMTFDSFDISQIKCDNITICYMFNDVYPYREIRELCINNSDYLFGTFTYLFPIWKDIYQRILDKPNCWIPYSAVNEFYSDIKLNENPIKKIFVSGYINDTYPLRKYMVELSKTNDNIEVLPHPNYEDTNRKHQYINKQYYEKLNNYLCCFNDALTWNYVNIKVFEIASVGSLLLIQDSIQEQLNELGYFDNVNCIMCNQNNLIEKIEWILDDNNLEDINIIRKRGMELTREKHNTEERSIKFNNYINNNLNLALVNNDDKLHSIKYISDTTAITQTLPKSCVPIIIVCYNNYKYVENTILQILKINKEYYKTILILNNSSNCPETINFLNNIDVKVINNENNGPWITRDVNSHIYNILPDKFILTDPDLEFNKNLPNNFIEILSELSDKYKTQKLGFALDISDYDKMYQSLYNGSNIYNWEIQFWENKIHNSNYELYDANIDTTFCLINKNFEGHMNMRIAGNFTAKHLPWYKDNKIYNLYENYILNTKTTRISSISLLILNNIENNYLKIYKNNELFFIENNNNQNLYFWKDIYNNWENDTFKVFDKYLSKDKILIDIGGWIGTTCMYGSRKSKHVYSIEADIKSFNDMSNNLRNNCIENYTLINKAIYNIDNIKIKFGKNKFLENSKMNDSTSQIYNDIESSSDCYFIETITLENIINNYKINPYEIGLIKVDIEGGEENILDELISIREKYNLSIYISFHYTWWNDKNLDRFNLTSEQKDIIVKYPFISLII
jgi:FkbM family methyltransferase